MAKVFNLQTSMVLFLGLVLSIEIPYILQIMTPEEFWLPGLYALFAILQPILYGIYHHLNFGIIYSKQTYKFSIITFITASISFLANYFLIKEFGLLGALIASVLVYSSQVFVTYLLSRKLYFIPFEWFKLLWFGFGFIVLFFLIDSVSIQQLDFTIYIAKKVKPTLITCLNLFDLGDNIIVKILTYSIYNLEIFFEAFIKGGLTLSFIILLLFAGIVPKRLIREIIHLSLRVKSFNFLSK